MDGLASISTACAVDVDTAAAGLMDELTSDADDGAMESVIRVMTVVCWEAKMVIEGPSDQGCTSQAIRPLNALDADWRKGCAETAIWMRSDPALTRTQREQGGMK